MKLTNLKTHKLIPLLMLAVLGMLWEAGVVIFKTPPWLLPAPSRVLEALWDTRTLIGAHTIPTLIESVSGLSTAIILGAAAAFLMEWSTFIRRALYPLLVISQSIPAIALAPLFAVWFGFGMISKILVIVLVCFFPIAVNITEGLRGIDTETLKVVRAMGASQWQLLLKVKLPASLPSFFSGLRIAASYSVLAAVIAEWFGAERGLGIFLVRAAKSYAIDRVFAIILIISILTLVLVWCTDRIARLSIPWHYKISLKNNPRL